MGGIKGEKGFTLIEVIITMAIFGLVIIVFSGILNCAAMIQQSSNKITKVNNNTAIAINNNTATASAGSIVLNIGGTPHTINGTFYTGSSEKVDTYKVFKPTGWSY